MNTHPTAAAGAVRSVKGDARSPSVGPSAQASFALCASSGRQGSEERSRRPLSASFLDGHDSGFSCPSTSRPRDLDAIFFGGTLGVQ
jgi:hypothetical protein